jgi:hypothetical protein
MDEQDDAMDEQTLVYWLNSLPVPSTLLLFATQPGQRDTPSPLLHCDAEYFLRPPVK